MTKINRHENELSELVLGKCIKIHKELGPGLFESVYEDIITYELSKAGLACQNQVELPVQYDGKTFERGFRADMIVDEKLLLELKSVEKLTSTHKKQILTYLRLSDLKLGLIINFNERLLKNGIVRIVNNLEE